MHGVVVCVFADDKNDMLSVRFVVERSFDKVSEKTSPSEMTWFVEVDTYVQVPGSLPFHGLIRHALSSLGYSDLEAISCKGWCECVSRCFFLTLISSWIINILFGLHSF